VQVTQFTLGKQGQVYYFEKLRFHYTTFSSVLFITDFFPSRIEDFGEVSWFTWTFFMHCSSLHIFRKSIVAGVTSDRKSRNTSEISGSLFVQLRHAFGRLRKSSEIRCVAMDSLHSSETRWIVVDKREKWRLNFSSRGIRIFVVAKNFNWSVRFSSIGWFSKRTGTSLDDGARSTNTQIWSN